MNFLKVRRHMLYDATPAPMPSLWMKTPSITMLTLNCVGNQHQVSTRQPRSNKRSTKLNLQRKTSRLCCSWRTWTKNMWFLNASTGSYQTSIPNSSMNTTCFWMNTLHSLIFIKSKRASTCWRLKLVTRRTRGSMWSILNWSLIMNDRKAR